MSTVSNTTIALPGGRWCAWTTVAVRGAGFPATWVERLASSDVVNAADRYIAARHAVITCRQAALRAVGTLLRNEGNTDARRRLRAIRRNFRKNTISGALRLPTEAALGEALEARSQALAALTAAYECATADADAALRDSAADNRFRSAALWQSRRAIIVASRKLEAAVSSRDRRSAAAFVAALLQRYCVKNDSIGFFGPVGWASLVDASVTAEVQPGRDLIAARQIFFEAWAIDRLADRFNENPGVRLWSAPRLRGGVFRVGDEVYVPVIGRVELSPAELSVIGSCDGQTPAAVIIETLLATELFRNSQPDQIVHMLERLVDLRVLAWRLEVAAQPHPETEMRAVVDRIGDAGVRTRCEVDLDRLVRARDEVSRSADDASRLEEALDRIDTTFAEVTGGATTRRPGRTYAGRGIIYEDCRRNCDVVLGGELLRQIGPALSVVLDSARWVSTELRRRFNELLRRYYRQLNVALRSERLDAQAFLNFVGARARADLAPISADIRREFQMRWLSVLGGEMNGKRIYRRVADVRPLADEVFAAVGASSWGGYFSPDVMIAADGAESLARGEFHGVIGEIHSNNTLLWRGLNALHPQPSSLVESLREDINGATIAVVQMPKTKWLARLSLLTLPDFWRYQHGDDPPEQPPCRPLPAAALVACDEEGVIKFRACDGRIEVDAYDLLAVTMSYESDRIAGDILRHAAHTPRVTLDNVTIRRERWTAAVHELDFLAERDRATLFARVREWAAACGMPRRIFYKSPAEPKPFYLDFNSVTYVDLFVRMMRRLAAADAVRLTEMLPSPEQTWLPDREGNRYTCELRLVARRTERA